MAKDRELKRIGVEIDSALWEEFRAFVKTKYKRTHGVLSLEVEEALKTVMMEAGYLDEDHHQKPEDDQPPLDHFGKGRNPPKLDQPVKHQGQPSETDAYIAGLDPKYNPVVAELEGM